MTWFLMSILGVATGLVLVARGLRPPAVSLADRLDRSTPEPVWTDESRVQSLWGRAATWLVVQTQADRMDRIEANLAANDVTLRSVAVDQLNAGLGAGAIGTIVVFGFGWTRSIVGLALLFAICFVIGFLLPDVESASKAASRREEFSECLTAFVSLVAVGISGGGGVNSAMRDTLDLGGEWPFRMLREAVDEAALAGEDLWVAFDRLGRRLQVEELIEFAGALGLAGTSGARVVETLQARAESSRDREKQLLLQRAERRSEHMNVPIAILALSWMVFVGYAAISGLIGA